MAINNNPQQPSYLIPGLPSGMGNSKAVVTDAAGNLAAGTIAVPGGANTNVQFNDSGVFGGTSGLTFNKSTNALTSTGQGTFQTVKVGLGGGAVATNLAVGASALYGIATGTSNTGVGYAALGPLTTGNNNTSVGSVSLASIQTGSDNAAFGSGALSSNVAASGNLAIGTSSLYSLLTGDNNIALGSYALFFAGRAVSAGSFVVGQVYTIYSVGSTDFTLIGAAANTVGTVFTATGVGTGSGTATTIATSNVAIGAQSLRNNVGGDSNVSIGFQSGYSLTYGGSNVFIGSGAGFANVTGFSNVGIGTSALSANTATANVAIGDGALATNTSGVNQTAIGTYALNVATGNNNTAIGMFAGRSISTGQQNVCVGSLAGYSGTQNITTGTNNIVIGYNVAVDSATASNQINIGNTYFHNRSALAGTAYASLPAAPAAGTIAYVTDSTVASPAAFGAVVNAGGGTSKFLVWFNGTNWTVIGT